MMGWLLGNRGGLSASDATQRDAGDDRWFTGLGGARSEIDVTVTVKRARQIPVVRSALKCLADSVAGLEHGAFRRISATKVERIENHPAALLLQDPNEDRTGFEFVYQIVDDLASHGDFLAERIFDNMGQTVGLRRLDPSPERMTVEELPDGSVRFDVRDRWGRGRKLLRDEVWHIPLPPLLDGIRGTSPILEDGREAVAVGIALQRYANILFTNDATPPYALYTDSHFRDEESRKNMLDAIRKWATGRNRHKIGMFEYGLKPHRMGLTAEEAQFLETRKELWIDLARIWRVPPHKVGLLDKATFSNIEHQSLEFVTDTLRPILELIERSVTKHLIGVPGVYFEFNVETLLRGDLEARYKAYALGRQWGWLSVNDVLALEKRNGIGRAGDRYVEPLNMVPVGTGTSERERDSQESINKSISFLRASAGGVRGRPRLELVKDAA
ncbi:phage portal protein [Mameliella sp. CS4]|uniref:phage portal protein n=1 Tax=Mameliella sp. CS4 TaxID=2862329 RepID=UPI001C5F05AF|nr:phage portal protein [Mameliella sp. CS4]MBW4985087.1 phage portal protein [Mameliella sp. CS4]